MYVLVEYRSNILVKYVSFLFEFDLKPITFRLKLDLDMIKMYLYYKKKFLLKLLALAIKMLQPEQTDIKTDTQTQL